MKISLHLVNFHHRRTGNSRLWAGEIHLKGKDLDLFLDIWSEQNNKNEIQDFLKSKNNINKNKIKP